MLRSLLVALLVATPLPALAHKVIASVFPSGNAIEGEIGLSNGAMAAGQLVEVHDGAGTPIGETVTDDDGFFVFVPTTPVTHVFRANLGAGHVAETRMPAEEVAAILGVAAPAPPPAPVPAGPGTVTVASLSDQERDAIARIVRDETRPLRREIAAYKDHNDFQTILGGIGYIMGLVGIGYYVAARRKLQG